MRRPLLLACLLAALAPAPARAADPPPLPGLGISDQKADTFADPRFRALGLPYARLVVPWDQVFARPHLLDRWLTEARRAGTTPLLALSAGNGQHCPKDPCIAPRVDEVVAAFDALRAAYPWVTEFQAWNEANHESQPTRVRPAMAAQYWDALARRCRTCTITAADVLGDDSMLPWLRRFRRAARVTPRLWGLHNYRDVNDRREDGTRALLRAVKGEVWFTETGGIVRFTTRDGRLIRPHDEERAARAIHRALDLGKVHGRRVRRIYLYNWRAGRPDERFDSGMVGSDGEARAGLRALWRRVNGLQPYPAEPERAHRAGPLALRYTTPSAAVRGEAVRRPRGRTMAVRVRCRPGRAVCWGQVVLSERRLGRLGAGAFALRGGEERVVAVTLSRAAAAALPRQRLGTRIGAELRLRTPSGAAAKAQRSLRLARRAARPEV